MPQAKQTATTNWKDIAKGIGAIFIGGFVAVIVEDILLPLLLGIIPIVYLIIKGSSVVAKIRGEQKRTGKTLRPILTTILNPLCWIGPSEEE